MTDSEKLNSILSHLKNDYEFHHEMSQSDRNDEAEKYIHKIISVILAQAIETVDYNFVRHDYRYEP